MIVNTSSMSILFLEIKKGGWWASSWTYAGKGCGYEENNSISGINSCTLQFKSSIVMKTEGTFEEANPDKLCDYLSWCYARPCVIHRHLLFFSYPILNELRGHLVKILVCFCLCAFILDVDCGAFFGWRYCSSFDLYTTWAEGIILHNMCHICSRFVISRCALLKLS